MKSTSLPVIFAFGSSRNKWGPLPLPFDFKVLGAPGCLLYASADLMVGGRTHTSGVPTFSVPIPNSPRFVNVLFYNQIMVNDPGANPAGIALTRAGAGKVGQ